MEYKKTVVLMWNPEISSVRESDYAEWFNGLCTFNEKFFNWSVWDYEHVGYGDRFLLVRVGDGKAGMVMEGMIASDCMEGNDWAGSDRKRYYVDLVPMTAYNPDCGAVYPLQSQLQDAIPDFDWSGGHSGRVLTDIQARKFDNLFKQFCYSTRRTAKDLSKVRSRQYIIPSSLIHPNEKERSRYCADDPRPFIESLVMQSMGIPANRIEEDWKKHEHMWVHGHESLLRAAAWLAFPLRIELPYYGALCLKLSLQYWGDGKNDINAAYAKEAADFLTDRKLRHLAVMIWLAESLRLHQYWGTGYAVDPLVSDKVSGLDVLSDFIGHDVLEADSMLHDYYVRNIEISIEHDYIDIDVSYGSVEEDEEILTFRIAGDISIKTNIEGETFLYIDSAKISPCGRDKVQLIIDGYGLRAGGRTIGIYTRQR